MYPLRQKFLVFGVSRSGKSAAEFLLEKTATVYLYDELSNERVEKTLRDLEEKGAIPVAKQDLEKICDACDALVLSPGIPVDHPLAVSFKRRGKAVIGETELAARVLRCPIVAVTGTNGKTTVVSMLEAVFKQGGWKTKACGNIGLPMIDVRDCGDDLIAVAEISSFQMETLHSLSPHISVILNITEDHLNRHYTMDNYVFLKEKLLKNATEAEYAVLNYDDEIVRGFAKKTKAKVVYFSVRERVRGAYYAQGDLYYFQEKILSVDKLPIGGLHNVQNALAVIAAAKLMGIATSAIVSALTDFKGVKHRLEKVDVFDGVTYIDDSKGTNVDATLKAIVAMKTDTILLLGGKNKGYNYDRLFANFAKSRVIHAVLYGENRYALLKSAMGIGYEEITLCKEFEAAVRIAALRATGGQTVLLSPASASFDAFANYEERGERFVEIIRAIHRQNTEKNVAREQGGDKETVCKADVDGNEIGFDDVFEIERGDTPTEKEYVSR